MNKIHLDRVLSAYCPGDSVRIYADGRLACQLSQEGEESDLVIEGDKVRIAAKSWGFRSKPITVKAGQTVSIYPRKSLILAYLATFVICAIVIYKIGEIYPWPDDQWNTTGHLIYRLALNLPLNSWIFAHKFLPIFAVKIKEEV